MSRAGRKLTIRMPDNPRLRGASIGRIHVDPGSRVSEGSPVLSLNVAGREHMVRAPRPGRVIPLVVPGDGASSGEPLYILNIDEQALAEANADSRSLVPVEKAKWSEGVTPEVIEPILRKRPERREGWLARLAGGWGKPILAVALYVLACFALLPILRLFAQIGNLSIVIAAAIGALGFGWMIARLYGDASGVLAKWTVRLVAVSWVGVAALALFGPPEAGTGLTASQAQQRIAALFDSGDPAEPPGPAPESQPQSRTEIAALAPAGQPVAAESAEEAEATIAEADAAEIALTETFEVAAATQAPTEIAPPPPASGVLRGRALGPPKPENQAPRSTLASSTAEPQSHGVSVRAWGRVPPPYGSGEHLDAPADELKPDVPTPVAATPAVQLAGALDIPVDLPPENIAERLQIATERGNAIVAEIRASELALPVPTASPEPETFAAVPSKVASAGVLADLVGPSTPGTLQRPVARDLELRRVFALLLGEPSRLGAPGAPPPIGTTDGAPRLAALRSGLPDYLDPDPLAFRKSAPEEEIWMAVQTGAAQADDLLTSLGDADTAGILALVRRAPQAGQAPLALPVGKIGLPEELSAIGSAPAGLAEIKDLFAGPSIAGGSSALTAPSVQDPVTLAALVDRVPAATPKILPPEPAFAERRALYIYFDDPRAESHPQIGDDWTPQLSPELEGAVRAARVEAVREVIQVSAWCPAAEDAASQDRQAWLNDRIRLLDVRLVIEPNSLAALEAELPIFGGGPPGFFHNRRPLLGGGANAPVMARAWDYLQASAGDTQIYFDDDQDLSAALTAAGCASAGWEADGPANAIGRRLAEAFPG